MHLIRGAQTDQVAVTGDVARCMRVSEEYQGFATTLGVPFTFPWVISHRPVSAEAFILFAGPPGQAKLQRQGLDYSVSLVTRQVTWLATARIALPANSVITVVYYRVGRAIQPSGSYPPQ